MKNFKINIIKHLLLILIFNILTFIETGTKKSFILFTPGVTTPNKLYQTNKDLFNNIWINQETNSLSDSGKRMAYLLGEEIKARYAKFPEFINPKYNLTQVVAYSVNTNSSIDSITSFFQGLYSYSKEEYAPLVSESLGDEIYYPSISKDKLGSNIKKSIKKLKNLALPKKTYFPISHILLSDEKYLTYDNEECRKFLSQNIFYLNNKTLINLLNDFYDENYSVLNKYNILKYNSDISYDEVMRYLDDIIEFITTYKVNYYSSKSLANVVNKKEIESLLLKCQEFERRLYFEYLFRFAKNSKDEKSYKVISNNIELKEYYNANDVLINEIFLPTITNDTYIDMNYLLKLQSSNFFSDLINSFDAAKKESKSDYDSFNLKVLSINNEILSSQIAFISSISNYTIKESDTLLFSSSLIYELEEVVVNDTINESDNEKEEAIEYYININFNFETILSMKYKDFVENNLVISDHIKLFCNYHTNIYLTVNENNLKIIIILETIISLIFIFIIGYIMCFGKRMNSRINYFKTNSGRSTYRSITSMGYTESRNNSRLANINESDLRNFLN